MSHLGPETRAIIEAVEKLRKPAHEDLNYFVREIDLAVARANELFELPGWFDHLSIAQLGGEASIRLNEPARDLIDLTQLTTIDSPIRRIYLTNDAQPGASLTIHLGGEAQFTTRPLRSTETIFVFFELDEDGGAGVFQASFAKTDTPTHVFPAAHRNPIFFKKGIALRVHYRLNPTNAATYTLRIYRAAYDDDYASNRSLLYESLALRADDTDYDVEIETPFIMLGAGIMLYAIEWTAAPGVTPGFVEVSGIVKP